MYRLNDFFPLNMNIPKHRMYCPQYQLTIGFATLHFWIKYGGCSVLLAFIEIKENGGSKNGYGNDTRFIKRCLESGANRRPTNYDTGLVTVSLNFHLPVFFRVLGVSELKPILLAYQFTPLP